MPRVFAVVEGQSEEMFIKTVLSPRLGHAGVAIIPILLKRTGGDPRWARAKGDVAKLLKQENDTFVTTMFDLYGLGYDWPARPHSRITHGIEAAEAIEAACVHSLAAEFDDNLRVRDRFLPHIQPFEFEALLFSDPQSLSRSLSSSAQVVSQLAAIRNEFQTPEHINDSPQTAPSKRIKKVVGYYEKVLYAAVAAAEVGLTAMRAQCPHFRAWLGRLEGLAAST